MRKKVYKVNLFFYNSPCSKDTLIVLADSIDEAKNNALKDTEYNYAKVSEFSVLDGYILAPVKISYHQNTHANMFSQNEQLFKNFKPGDMVICIVGYDKMIAPCEVCEVESVYSEGTLLKLRGHIRMFDSSMFRLY